MQGKDEAAAQKLLDDAKAIAEAGVFAIVLECVPSALAKKVTEAVDVPTIGIGAGADCDGQILVYQDMLGMFSDFTPKFVKRYANIGEAMKAAFKGYIDEVWGALSRLRSMDTAFQMKSLRNYTRRQL